MVFQKLITKEPTDRPWWDTNTIWDHRHVAWVRRFDPSKASPMHAHSLCYGPHDRPERLGWCRTVAFRSNHKALEHFMRRRITAN